MMKHIWDPEFILQNPQLIFVDLDEPNNPRDFIVSLLAYFLKNSELAREKIKGFIEILPRTLNQTAMSTYEMILEEGIEQGRIKEREIGQELLTKERLRAEGEHLRAEEERLRAEGEHLRAEEERLRLDNVIIYLHEISHLPLPEIALMTDHTIAYIEVLIAKRNEEV